MLYIYNTPTVISNQAPRYLFAKDGARQLYLPISLFAMDDRNIEGSATVLCSRLRLQTTDAAGELLAAEEFQGKNY